MSQKPLAIIAVDAGKTTGVAVWRQDHDLTSPGDSLDSFELTVEQFFEFVKVWSAHLNEAGYEVHVVCESFLITMHTAKNTQASWSLELNGVMMYISHIYGWKYTQQAPSIGKTFGTNAKLKFMNWMKGRKTIDGVHYAGHADDAARHLMTYAAQRGLIFSKEQLIGMAQVA